MFNITEILLIATSVLAVIALILCLVMYIKYRKFQQAFIALDRFVSGESVEQLLKNNLLQTEKILKQLETAEQRIEKLENKARNTIDYGAIVRFNSLEKMGGELSFALALLDQESSGIVINSIHSVEECRVYGKAIVNGTTQARLSNEETRAIEEAQKKIYKI